MAKQQMIFNLTPSMVAQAIRDYAAGMVEQSAYDIELVDTVRAVTVRATRKHARKAKAAKVAAMPKAAA